MTDRSSIHSGRSSEDELAGAGEALDCTVMPAPVDNEDDAQSNAADDRPQIGAHASADVDDGVDDGESITIRLQTAEDVVDDLRRRMASMQTEMASYKRANENYNRELGSIQLAAEIASNRSSSRRSSTQSCRSEYSDFQPLSAMQPLQPTSVVPLAAPQMMGRTTSTQMFTYPASTLAASAAVPTPATTAYYYRSSTPLGQQVSFQPAAPPTVHTAPVTIASAPIVSTATRPTAPNAYVQYRAVPTQMCPEVPQFGTATAPQHSYPMSQHGVTAPPVGWPAPACTRATTSAYLAPPAPGAFVGYGAPYVQPAANATSRHYAYSSACYIPSSAAVAPPLLQTPYMSSQPAVLPPQQQQHINIRPLYANNAVPRPSTAQPAVHHSAAPLPSTPLYYGAPSMQPVAPPPPQHNYTQHAAQPDVPRSFPSDQHVPTEDRFAAGSRRSHELPSFGGRAEEWPFFISAYTRTTQLYGYSSVENMLRLQRCLVGEAKRRVTSILVRPEHVDRAMDALAKAYGRPEALLESQFNMVHKLPKVDGDNRQQMVDFSITVDGIISFFDFDGLRHHLSNSHLLNQLESKLSMADRKSWANVARHMPQPSIRDFAVWLDNAAAIMSSIRNYTGDGEETRPRQGRAEKTAAKQKSEKYVLLNVAAETSSGGSVECAFCAERHNIRRCSKFLRLSVDARLQAIKQNPLCYSCLQKGHLLPSCSTRTKCGFDGCDMWHDKLLHQGRISASSKTKTQRSTNRQRVREQSSSNVAANATDADTAQQPPTAPNPNAPTAPNPTGVPAPNTASSERSAVLNCQASQPGRLLLYRVVPVFLYGPQQKLQTWALLDEGSSVTLIDSSLADELGLEGVDADLSLQFANAQSTVQATRVVSFSISGIDPGAAKFDMQHVYSTDALALPTQTIDRTEIVRDNGHLSDVPFAEFASARPRLLIGLEHHHLGVPSQIRTSALTNGIVAAMTQLGWVLFGSNGRSTAPSAVVLHIRHQDEDVQSREEERWAQLNEIVQRYFATEEFGASASTAVIESDGLQRARRILAQTTRRVGGRFETGLLWAADDVDLPDSRAMALQRLVGVEARMRRDAAYGDSYRAQIRTYLDKGYARRATPAEAAMSGGRSWFLPHFAVRSVSKPGKFRLVFDAAATVNGVALNSALLAGPDINVPLLKLLFKFRLGSVGVCADVREMYHQVRIRKEDQVAQRFLWRDGDATAQVETFVMNVMTFGSTCSPASAQFVKNLNASEFEEAYPEAVAAICRNHYVDDYVCSFESTSDAIRITSDVIDIQRQGGFELRGVISSDVAVQQRFGETDGAQTVSLEPEGIVQKILGMTWETADDTFCFRTNFGRVRAGIVDGSVRPSKRDILSVAMSIFDPFGLLADFVLASKVILQELWRTNAGWDEPISDDINTAWQAWRALIDRTRLVRIPRCYSPHIIREPGLQLHVFADASEEAFAAVAYWRVKERDGVQIVFAAGKVRCAPMKVLSVPRMELLAAVLAARLMVEVCECHSELNIDDVRLWSDSETVLNWLRCDRRRYKMWVGVRVAEVVEKSAAAVWRWVPSALNPADDATRVKMPLAFDPEGRWRRGPAWLTSGEESWPVKQFAVAPDDAHNEEIRAKFSGAIVQRGAVDYGRFSKFSRLTRTMAWVWRFVTNARERQEQRVRGELTASEVDRAIMMTCRLVQQESYGEELSKLRKGEQLSTRAEIFVLRPYIDTDGVLRVHGRADAADERFVSSDAKRPILLPRKHRVTMLLVRHHHEQFAHQLTDATIAAVRCRYWVPQIRRLVGEVQRDCQLCKVRKAAPPPTIQGQLPRDRMDVLARPFTNTGMDFFGPVAVTVGRRREKRWVALFTCLTVRAVHLEIAADLSTDACLMCIRNLCNIRGVPALIRCDNGTNFVGARNEMGREESFFDAEEIQRELSVKGTRWLFNCPANPEAGGAWERLVQSVKRVLRVTLLEEAPKVETLRSLLIAAANIINARPLTHLSVTPEDPEPLTPNHFLLGGPNVATVPLPAEDEPIVTRKQWRISRDLSRRFWRQFVRDYLPELTRRGKHYPEQPPLQVGDLVIVCDHQQPRSRWNRGRIVDVAVGSDGVVRTASVETGGGILRRPANKMARLDVGCV